MCMCECVRRSISLLNTLFLLLCFFLFAASFYYIASSFLPILVFVYKSFKTFFPFCLCFFVHFTLFSIYIVICVHVSVKQRESFNLLLRHSTQIVNASPYANIRAEKQKRARAFSRDLRKCKWKKRGMSEYNSNAWKNLFGVQMCV